MAIVTGVTKRVPIPHEPDEWMDFRLLSGKQLRHAREVRQIAVQRLSSAMGSDFREMLTDLREQLKAEEAAKAAAEVEPTEEELITEELNQYDIETILKLGIVNWSYAATVNADTIGELDEETSDWAARELVRIRRTAAHRKNASSPSTVSSMDTELRASGLTLAS